MKKIVLLFILLTLSTKIYSEEYFLHIRYLYGMGNSYNSDVLRVGTEALYSNFSNGVILRGEMLDFERVETYEKWGNLQYGYGISYTYLNDVLYSKRNDYKWDDKEYVTILSPFDQYSLYLMLKLSSKLRGVMAPLRTDYLYYKFKVCFNVLTDKNSKMEYYNFNDEKRYQNRGEVFTFSFSFDNEIGIEFPLGDNYILNLFSNIKEYKINYREIEYKENGERIKYNRSEANTIISVGACFILKI